MKLSTLCIAILVVFFKNSESHAQASKTGPEHKRLELWLGTWTLEADVKAGPFGPPGKARGRDRVELGPGGFTIVFDSDITGPGGNVKSLGIIGYDTGAKSYTWYGVDSNGAVTTAQGSLKGNTWTWTTESKVAGKTVKGRSTAAFASPTAYTFRFEIADEKGAYSVIEEGKALKAR